MTSTASRMLGHVKSWYDPSHPNAPAPPQPPNQNDAMNQGQTVADQMRARRGVLANIYAGAANTQPVTGKVQLGT